MPDAGETLDDLGDETLQFAQRAWDDAEREHRDHQNRRDRALNQLSTTRTVSWAMATVLGGAVVLAGDQADGALADLGVQISLATTVACLAAAILLSVIPDFWPQWADLPGAEVAIGFDPDLSYSRLLWWMSELASLSNQRNAVAMARVEKLVGVASVLSAISALGLLSAAILAVLALR